MGYESRLYVIHKSEFSPEENGLKWSEVIAKFNLCKCGGGFINQISEYGPTDSFFFENDKEIVEDCYGEPLTEIPLEDMISIIEKCMETEPYRRWQPCIGLLKGFNQSEWGDKLVVLHFGY